MSHTTDEPLAALLHPSTVWTSFKDMHECVVRYGKRMGFIVRHNPKATLHRCGDGDRPPAPVSVSPSALDLTSSVPTSGHTHPPFTVQPAAAMDSSSLLPVDSTTSSSQVSPAVTSFSPQSGPLLGDVAIGESGNVPMSIYQRIHHVSSTSLVRPTDVIDTYMGRDEKVQRMYLVRNSLTSGAAVTSAVAVTIPSTQNVGAVPAPTGSVPSSSEFDNVEQLIVTGVRVGDDGRKIEDSCRLAGCLPQRGWFQCEFRPNRGGGRGGGPNEEGDVGRGERKQGTASRAQLQCSNGRKCDWRLNYFFSKTTKTYVVTPAQLQHTGHLMELASESWDVQPLFEAKDITNAMEERLRFWLTSNLHASQVRRVRPRNKPITYTSTSA
jgi:hypothetical protein